MFESIYQAQRNENTNFVQTQQRKLKRTKMKKMSYKFNTMILSSLFSVSVDFSLNATILNCANDQKNPHTHTHQIFIYKSRASSEIYSNTNIKHEKSVTIRTYKEKTRNSFQICIYKFVSCVLTRRVKARKQILSNKKSVSCCYRHAFVDLLVIWFRRLFVQNELFFRDISLVVVVVVGRILLYVSCSLIAHDIRCLLERHMLFEANLIELSPKHKITSMVLAMIHSLTLYCAYHRI